MTHESNSVSARLARLERENTRLKKGAAVCGVLVACGLLMAQDGSGVHSIGATEFVVRDKDQKPRIWLGLDDKGVAKLVFYGEHEDTSRLQLSATRTKDASIALCDRDGQPRVWFDVKADGATQLGFLDDSGTQRAWLRASERGDPQLALLNRDGKPVSVWKTSKDTGPQLVLSDDDQRERVHLGLDQDGAPGLTLSNRKGDPGLEALLPKSGKPLLQLTDARGRVVFKEP